MKSSKQWVAGWLSLNLIFTVTVAAWIRLIPFDSAPDEYCHFHYNVDVILRQHRLPISGVDDLEAYARVTPKLWGPVVSIYSYCVYPQLNYLVSALSSGVMERALGWPAWRGARVASMGWGLVYLNALFLSVWLLTRRNLPVTLAVTGAAGFIPQIVYISAYTNADIHSLASSALLALALVYYAQPKRRHATLLLGLASGLLLTAKYNYFLLAPLIPIVMAGVWWRRREPIKQLGIAWLAVGILAISLSGFWYVRNYVLYRDPLGVSFMLELMKQYGDPLPSQPLSLASLRLLAGLHFHGGTFESLIGRFGYMNVPLPGLAYRITLVVLLGAGLALPIIFVRGRDGVALGGLAALLLLLLAVAGLHVANTLAVDFQPQGRYLFPGLVPLALFMAWAAARHKAVFRLILLVALLMAGLLVVSHQTLRAAYPEPRPPAVLLD